MNLAVFGLTAKDWREQNPALKTTSENIRDQATIEQLTVLANLESLNSMLIHETIDKISRFDRLHAEASRQLQALLDLRQHTTHLLEPKKD